MGSRFAGRHARQHPDLTAPDHGTSSRFRILVLVLLALDGVIVAFTSALFLPEFLGKVPFPVSALIAGGMNLALVWAAGQWAPGRLAALPLGAFLITIAALSLGGPGGDVLFGGEGFLGAEALLLVVLGTGPGLWWLLRRGASGTGPAS
ncbi:MAG: hypothetical protein KDB70_08945 [Mycobacterium sp.]|nr:hypothetical protein [Mycobacterium sp.]